MGIRIKEGGGGGKRKAQLRRVFVSLLREAEEKREPYERTTEFLTSIFTKLMTKYRTHISKWKVM